MNPSDLNITDLIPQRPPMQMIDRLVYADDRSAKGSLYIKATNLFSEKGFLRESGLIEFIAQTAAAFTGYRNKMNSGSVNEGYIGAIKNLVISSLPPVNSEIQSEIMVENEIVGFTIVTGKVFCKNRVIAECEMRILGKQNIPL
ncbi:MAG: pseudouridylate synthase [Bacteroidales bacterium]|nr:pseudouridylate synthase [Bacteroidales bacterium]